MGNEILQDLKNGKETPWRAKKVKAISVSDSFRRLGMDNKADNIKYCGMSLQFVRSLETGEKQLFKAAFCKERLCSLCQWRKSLKVFHQVSRVMDAVQLGYPRLVPLFLTLTVRNCDVDRLPGEVDNVLKSWFRLIDHYRFRKIIKGWFRALEITYSETRDSFHPHIHAIILVDKSYFKSDDFMSTSDWVSAWRTALGVDYDPICDIRKVRGQSTHKAVAEVAKYTLKDSDFVKPDHDLMDKLVLTFFLSLHGRRLHAFGGIMKQVAKQLALDDIENGDLIRVGEEEIRADVAKVIETYRWRFGSCNYIKD